MSAELNSIRLKIAELFDKWSHKVNVFLTEKMVLSQWMKIVCIWVLVWVALASVSSTFKAVLWISTGLLSVHFANWIYQAVRTAAPKTLIKSTSGKAVVITGCDTGFGHQVAVRLHELGFKVYAGCLYPEGEGAKALLKKSSGGIHILKIDVTDDVSIKDAFLVVKQQLEKSKDRLWAVVNNAGIAAVIEIEWCPIELYRKVFDVNALGLVRVTKTFLPLIRQNEGSRIIFVTSLAGRYTTPGFSAYSMSKHAAASFADGLRLEMRKWNVTVHTVEPTLYKTPIADISQIHNTVDKMWDECPSEIKKSYGVEYLQDFKDTLRDHLQRAKPSEKIHEVIDDMVHAVAGEEPKCRYVPSLKTQFHDHFLSSLPIEVLDNFLAKLQPQTPPADIEGLRATRFQF